VKGMLEKIKTMSEEIKEEIVELRHYFHRNPELSWKEKETTARIRSILEDLGYQNIKTGFGGTESGVTAELNPEKDGACIALRADIDALPIEEDNEVEYRSKNKGVMHACGHDAHAAMLIGVARILADIKDEIPGKVKMIFQPAEEAGINSGGQIMVKEGVLEGVDAIAGMHIWANVPSGKVGFRAGPIMASADIWEINVKGQGGHGSMPQNAVDPTIAAATLISTMQTVVSREIDPQETVVLSIGHIEAGNAPNVIPETAKLTGNVRTTNRETREIVPAKMERIMQGVCSALRCEGQLEFTNIYPVTVNDPDMTEVARAVAVEMYGSETAEEAPLMLGSEDFSYYEEKVPGTFFLLGCGNADKGTDNQHHSPRFNVDDDVLDKGMAIMAGIAWEYLSEGTA